MHKWRRTGPEEAILKGDEPGRPEATAGTEDRCGYRAYRPNSEFGRERQAYGIFLAGMPKTRSILEKKHETFYVISGRMKFYVGENKDDLATFILEPGQNYVIKPFIVHRMEAVNDCIYIECSTNFLDDVIRLEDKYGRK
jgi:mannose-6-phosphate isomerase-like protein (cupin superfamily)